MNKHNGHGQSWPNWSERLFSNGKLTSAISAAARASWPATELPTKRIWSGFRLWTIPFRPLSSNVFAPWHLERKKKKKKGPSEPFCSWSSVFRSDNLITRGTFLYGRQLNQRVIRSHRKKHCRRVNRKLSKVRGTGIRLRRRHLVPCQIRDAAKSLIWQDDTTV